MLSNKAHLLQMPGKDLEIKMLVLLTLGGSTERQATAYVRIRLLVFSDPWVQQRFPSILDGPRCQPRTLKEWCLTFPYQAFRIEACFGPCTHLIAWSLEAGRAIESRTRETPGAGEYLNVRGRPCQDCAPSANKAGRHTKT